MKKYQRKIHTTIGNIYLVASDDALCGVYWNKQEHPKEMANSNATKILNKAEKQITDYLMGKLVQFNLPLQLEGTPFQKRVWSELQKIPYGETRSYKEIALALNDPHASRAVGTANGKNPISLIIPCHRVINAGGKLGGYAGGITTKEKLLKLENSIG